MKRILIMAFAVLIVQLRAQVLINEIYGGAGSTSGTWNQEVIILKNYGNTEIDISDWAIQYTSAAGTGAWSIAAIPGTVILQPGEYFHFCVSNTQTGLSTPQCDATSTTSITMSASSGRVALTNNETQLAAGSNVCPAIGGNVVDFVPYGTSTNCTPETPNASATTSVKRVDETSTPADWFVNSTPLPVKLGKFEVKLKDNSAILNWSTFSEINNSHFIAEHSVDGQLFSEIGQVKGAGNSTSELHYELIHENPVRGINYYRLSQVDFDGKSETFDVKWIKLQGNKSIKIYPYQVSQNLIIEGQEENSIISVYNSIGILLKEYENVQNINMSDFQQGIYFIKVNDIVERIIKI